jgi:hypothetical protein
MKRRIFAILFTFLIVFSIVEVGAYIAKPTIQSPSLGATGVECKPTLRWIKVSYAITYEVNLSRYSDYRSLIVDKEITTVYYQVPTTLSGNTKYYWKVRAKRYSETSDWSTSYFTTGVCGGDGEGELTAPNLVSPVNNTTWTQSLYPTFQWQSVVGADSYTIQISRSSSDFSSTYLVKEATVFSTYYMVDTALSNCTIFYWRVRAKDSDSSGDWSSVWKFTTQVPPNQPILTSPLDGVVLTTQRPNFTWQSAMGATAYTIEIDGATYSVSATSFTPYSNLSTGSHTWRVRATSCGGGQTSDWSQQRSFTIDLDDVVLEEPANNSTITDTTPQFSWNAVDEATQYKLEVRRETVDGQKVFEVEVTGTSFTPTAILNPGTYVWRVMAYRNGSWTMSWSSQPFTFILQTGEGLIAPQLQAPISGSAVDFPLTLQWGSVTGAYSYTLEYAREDSFQDAESRTLFGTNYTLTSALGEGRWYWRVRANTSQGDNGPWSNTWSFEVGLPVPQLSSPSNGSTQSTSSVTFDWTDVTGSQVGGELYDLDHYVLQYSTSNAFSSQNTITIQEDNGQPLRISDYGPVNLGDTTYYWRVKAVYTKYPEGTLRDGSWTPTYSFTIFTGGVNIPSLVSPISGSVIKGTSVTLAWDPVESSGVTGYVLVYMRDTASNPGNPSQWTEGSYTEVIIAGQSTSSYTITLAENTPAEPFYWWSIATVNSSGEKGTFPSPINFAIDNTPPDIGSVELVQPVNTTLQTRIPTFTWRIPLTEYQDVTSWTIEYASDTQLQQNRRTITGLTNLSTIISQNKASISYTLTSSQALINGTWYWHLSATDAAGNISTFTTVASFVVDAGEEEPVVVSLISPPNGFENTPKRPTFSWLPAQGATTYQLQVSADSSFTSLEIDEDNITTTSYMAPSDLEPGTFYWRVNSNAPNSEWSDPWTFIISGEETPAEQVVLTSPSSGNQNASSTPLFIWQSVEGASSYTLEVSTSTSFNTTVVNKSVSSTQWGTASEWENNSPTELGSGTYYWRVSATNMPDSMSAIWNFTVPEPESEGEISLIVILSNINDDAISGASVTLIQGTSTVAQTTTDASGSVTFTQLESGTYRLEITAEGYSPYTETLNLSSTTTKNITLYRGAVIHGYVYYDNTQNPAANVAVRVYESENQVQVVSDITDTNGYFIMDDIPQDQTYYIIVESYEDQKKQGIIPVSEPTTANALTIIVKTEGEIIGVVQDEQGSPLAGAKVTLRDSQGQFVNSTSTINIGSFTFKVTPGKYYIEVTLAGYEDYTGDVFTVEYKEVEDVGLVTLISKTGTLVVNVQGEGGQPLEAIVNITDDAGNVVSTLSVSGGTASMDLEVGTYALQADADGYQPQTASGIVIESGTTVSQDFVLSLALGSIKLMVTDPEGMPIPDTQILVDGESVGSTDENGEFIVTEVSPEDHEISVSKEGYTAYQEIQTVNPEETLVLDLTLEERGFPRIYVAIPVIAAVAGAVYFFLKGRGPSPERPRTSTPTRREKTRIPTGTRREGLPKQSYRRR